jgi:hypothetical protein
MTVSALPPSPAALETLALRLAARTGLRTTTCREVLAGRYQKYSKRIRLRAAAGIESILVSDGGSPVVYADPKVSAPKDNSFLGNLARAIVAGSVAFGGNLANHAAKGFLGWVTGAGADTGGSEEGEDDGGGEGEGEGSGEGEE